jgi:pyruvate formate lyase activating enzyme
VTSAACPNKVFQVVGEMVSVDQVMEQIRKDRPFYRNGGGATLCGGEPLFQVDFALAILTACRKENIGTVLDTSGFAPPAAVGEAARLSDLVLLDIKHMDPEAHRRETGVDNRLILENAECMARLTAVRVSVPLIPGFNDSAENLCRTAEFCVHIGAQAMDINPMHILGSEKYRAMGRPVPYAHFGTVDMDEIGRLANMVRRIGINVTIGRMM